MRRGVETAKRENVAPIKKMVGPLAPSNYLTPSALALRNRHAVPAWYLAVVAVLSFALGVAAILLMRQDIGVPNSERRQMIHGEGSRDLEKRGNRRNELNEGIIGHE